jgi:hypothetical protein
MLAKLLFLKTLFFEARSALPADSVRGQIGRTPQYTDYKCRISAGVENQLLWRPSR